jgi:AcrR family transcriptional regulator
MPRPRTDIQPRVLRSARARFVADGVEGASLRRIAKDAKTSIGMVYYYYPTKDALFLAVVEDVYARLLASLEEVLGARAPARERLTRAFERLGAASDDEIDIVRLVIREALGSSDRFRAVLDRFKVGHIAMMLRTVTEAIDAGELDGGRPAPLLTLIAFGIGGVPQIMRRVAGADLPLFPLPSSAELARASTDILFDGAGAKTDTRPSGGRSRTRGRPVTAKRKSAG